MISSSLNSSNYSFFEKIKSVDYFLILLVLLIGAISVFSIYSTESGEFSFYTKNHLIRLVSFFLLFLAFSFVRVSTWYRQAYTFYLLGLLLLLLVIFFGISASGSKRWINLIVFNLQPSELMKIAVIVSFARYYHRIQTADIESYKYLLQPIILLLIPCYLVITQPDLGTASMILFISFIIFFISALSWKFFASIGIGFLIIAHYLWNSLKNYQKQRILTLFNPENDPLGSGYHIIQSQIAIGSGGTFGKGWMKGTQSHLDFLPEKHTDFIFSMLGEEFGFFGTISVIGLIVLITYLTYQIVNNSKIDTFQRILGFGIISNFFFAALINMSMVIGILPIVGLPLPLVSYGGSSMLTYFIGFGLILSIKLGLDRKY